MLLKKLAAARVVVLKAVVLGLLLGAAHTVTTARAVADETVAGVYIWNLAGSAATFGWSPDGSTWHTLGSVGQSGHSVFRIPPTSGSDIYVCSYFPDGSKQVVTLQYRGTTPEGNYYYEWRYSPN